MKAINSRYISEPEQAPTGLSRISRVRNLDLELNQIDKHCKDTGWSEVRSIAVSASVRL